MHEGKGKGPACSDESGCSSSEKNGGPGRCPGHLRLNPGPSPAPAFVPTEVWPSPMDQDKIRSNFDEFEKRRAAKAAGEVSDESESDPAIESAFLEASDEEEEEEDVDVSGLSDDVMDLVVDSDSEKTVKAKEPFLHAWI